MSVFKRKPDGTSGGSGGLFVKLQDGGSIVGVCRGEFEESYEIYENGKPRPAAPHEGKAKWRFKVNFVTNENGVLSAKILGGGKQIADALDEISKEYDLQKTLVKITRRGLMLETEYSVIVPKGGELGAEQLAKIADIKLHNLKNEEKSEDLPF